MKTLEPDDELIIIPINKNEHKVTIRDETESRLTIYIEPIDQPEKKEKE